MPLNKSKQKESFRKYLVKQILINAIAMLLAVVLLVLVALWGLNIYTNHGAYVKVPAIKGMSVEEAEVLLLQNNLKYEIVDSLYVGAKPGSIIEVIPEEHSKIKKDKVFLKIQAEGQKMVAIPELVNYSERQAVSILKSLGFKSIHIEITSSIYKNLVLDVLNRGVSVKPLEKVAINTPITLLVGGGGEVAIDSIIDYFPESVEPLDNYTKGNQRKEEHNPYFD